MNAKLYRERKVWQERALNPRLYRGYARKVVAPRLSALHAEIRAEIAHKIAPEIMADVEVPAYRHKSANRRKTDSGRAGSLPHFYAMGANDAGADLSAANNVGFAILANG